MAPHSAALSNAGPISNQVQPKRNINSIQIANSTAPLRSNVLTESNQAPLSPASSNPKLKSIRYMHTNATSFNQSKLLELSAYIFDRKPDLIFVIETWFTPHSSHRLDDFEIHRQESTGYH